MSFDRRFNAFWHPVSIPLLSCFPSLSDLQDGSRCGVDMVSLVILVHKPIRARVRTAEVYIATTEGESSRGSVVRTEGSKQMAYCQWSGIAPQVFGTIPAPK